MFPAGLGSQKPRFANQQRLAGRNQVPTIIVGGCSMWNPPTALPFVCEIHKLNCPGPLFKNTLILRGACITTICLNLSLQPTELKEKYYKRSPWETHFFLKLWVKPNSRSQCWWLWQVLPLGRGMRRLQRPRQNWCREAEAAVAEKKS